MVNGITYCSVSVDSISILFNAMFKLGRNIKPEIVIDLIKKCEKYRTICDAPLWKKKIEEIVDVTVSEDLYL